MSPGTIINSSTIMTPACSILDIATESNACSVAGTHRSDRCGLSTGAKQDSKGSFAKQQGLNPSVGLHGLGLERGKEWPIKVFNRVVHEPWLQPLTVFLHAKIWKEHKAQFPSLKTLVEMIMRLDGLHSTSLLNKPLAMSTTHGAAANLLGLTSWHTNNGWSDSNQQLPTNHKITGSWANNYMLNFPLDSSS